MVTPISLMRPKPSDAGDRIWRLLDSRVAIHGSKSGAQNRKVDDPIVFQQIHSFWCEVDGI